MERLPPMFRRLESKLLSPSRSSTKTLFSVSRILRVTASSPPCPWINTSAEIAPSSRPSTVRESLPSPSSIVSTFVGSRKTIVSNVPLVLRICTRSSSRLPLSSRIASLSSPFRTMRCESGAAVSPAPSSSGSLLSVEFAAALMLRESPATAG